MATVDKSENQESKVRDILDDDIDAQRAAGNLHYLRTLEIIRDRLRALEQPKTPFHGVAWLIECAFDGGRPDYYCAPAVWCNNPYHAHKFNTREEAEACSAEMHTIGTRRVTEHSWS